MLSDKTLRAYAKRIAVHILEQEDAELAKEWPGVKHIRPQESVDQIVDWYYKRLRAHARKHPRARIVVVPFTENKKVVGRLYVGNPEDIEMIRKAVGA